MGLQWPLLVNDRGDGLAVGRTAGHVADRIPVPQRVRRWGGKLGGDKGYRSQPLTAQLRQRDLPLVTRLPSTMKNRLLLLSDKRLLGRRRILDTLPDQRKHLSPIEQTRHRCLANLRVKLVAALIASWHQPKKPALALARPPLAALLPN